MATIYRADRSPYWYARFRDGDGYARQSTKETSRVAAQRKADEFEAAALVATKKAGGGYGPKFEAAVARFLAEQPLKPKTKASYESSWRYIQGMLKDFWLKDLTKVGINNLIRARNAAGEFTAAHRDIAFLSSLYRAASTWENGPDFNPRAWVDRRLLVKLKRREVVLTEEEVQRLLDACREQRHKDYIILAANSGMRRGEICGLMWSEVNLAKRQVVLSGSRTKNGKSRVVPLSKENVYILSRRLMDRKTDYVFPSPKTGKPQVEIKTFFNRVRRVAGLPNIHFHDLRHTFATWAEQRGVTPEMMRRLLGHSSTRQTDGYAHGEAATAARVMEVFDGSRLCDRQPTDNHDIQEAEVSKSIETKELGGAPEEIRTPNLLIRSSSAGTQNPLTFQDLKRLMSGS